MQQDKTLYTVVVADDEEELRQAVCGMIPWETLGFRLAGSAGNGLDALELVEKLEPDLLLTDIRMPFISGIELARQVREVRPFMHIAFLSGFDDFEYAKQAIQYNIISYMLKPLTMEGIEKELRIIRDKMDTQFQKFREQSQLMSSRENFLLPLLMDDYAERWRSEEWLYTAACESGLLQPGDGAHFVVITVALSDSAGCNRTSPDTIHAIDLIARKYLRSAGFYAGGKAVTLLMGNPSDFEEYLHILTSELIQMAQRVMHLDCSMGVSREKDSLGTLHAAYREAMEALNYAEPGRSNLVFLSDMEPLTEEHADRMTDMVAQIQTAFKSGSRELVEKSIDEMISMAHAQRYGKEWLDMAALQLTSEIYRILYSAVGGEALTELHNRELLPAFGFRYRPAEQVKRELKDFCLCAMELLGAQQQKGGSLLCRRALEYIEQNYADESLSLVSLSAVLDVSPNHLSACIKKYAGETFINILISKRMEAARELLLTTPLKVLEIAQRCGYSDQHYFSYCFKKYCGAPPNSLRRQSGGLGGGAQ